MLVLIEAIKIFAIKLTKNETKDNVLIIVAQDSRSQHKNKDIVIKRFLDLLKEGLNLYMLIISETTESVNFFASSGV